jgi:hypothetical protein
VVRCFFLVNCVAGYFWEAEVKIEDLKAQVMNFDQLDSWDPLRHTMPMLAYEIIALVEADNAWAKLRAEMQSAGTPPHSDFWSQSVWEVRTLQESALNEFNAALEAL